MGKYMLNGVMVRCEALWYGRLNELYTKMYGNIDLMILTAIKPNFFSIFIFQVIDVIDTAPEFTKELFAAGINIGDKVGDLVTTFTVSTKLQLKLPTQVRSPKAEF